MVGDHIMEWAKRGLGILMFICRAMSTTPIIQSCFVPLLIGWWCLSFLKYQTIYWEHRLG